MEDFTYYRNVKGFKEFEISFFPSTRKFRNAVRLFSRHGCGKGEKFREKGRGVVWLETNKNCPTLLNFPRHGFLRLTRCKNSFDNECLFFRQSTFRMTKTRGINSLYRFFNLI